MSSRTAWSNNMGLNTIAAYPLLCWHWWCQSENRRSEMDHQPTANQLQPSAKKSFPTWQSADTLNCSFYAQSEYIWIFELKIGFDKAASPYSLLGEAAEKICPVLQHSNVSSMMNHPFLFFCFFRGTRSKVSIKVDWGLSGESRRVTG